MAWLAWKPQDLRSPAHMSSAHKVDDGVLIFPNKCGFFGRGHRLSHGAGFERSTPLQDASNFYGPCKTQMLDVTLTLFSLLVWEIEPALGAAPALADGRRFPADLMHVGVCTFQGKPVKNK